MAGDGTAKKEEKVLTINVKPGWKSGTKITFQREGDQVKQKSVKKFLLYMKALVSS